MNLSSPFFTWTCLFPDDATYRFAPHTPWARQNGGTMGDRDGRAVFVTSGQAASDLPDLAAYHGLVALNGRVSDRQLREAGLRYIRRFAVLPSARNPRWFIPLDTPAVSAGAFCIYVPFAAASRLTQQGARAVARLGLPWWYRDEICIAQRLAPPLEEVLQSLFPQLPLRLAISSGTPPPAINRKTSLAVLAPDGRVKAFAKLPGPSPLSHLNVRREAAVLSCLGSARRSAQLLFAGDVGTRYVAVCTPLRGRAPGLEPAEAHARFLDSLRTTQLKIAAETAFARRLVERAHLLRERPALLAALHDLLLHFRTLRLPATIVHGDFVPWNLREHQGTIAAFDWEYGEIDGLPLIDETHHLLAVGYLLKKWTPAQACQRLRQAADSAPLGLPPETVRALQLAYLLDYLLRLFDEGHGDDYPRVNWCREIIARLAPATAEGVAA